MHDNICCLQGVVLNKGSTEGINNLAEAKELISLVAILFYFHKVQVHGANITTGHDGIQDVEARDDIMEHATLATCTVCATLHH